jgi:hypothetical protein
MLADCDQAAAESVGGVACRRPGKYENPTMTPISIDSSHTFIARYPSFRLFPGKFAHRKPRSPLKNGYLSALWALPIWVS